MTDISSPQPEDLKDIESISIDGVPHIGVADLQQFLQASRSNFYLRLKELDIAPVRSGKQSYLNPEQVRLILDLHAYLKADSRRTVATWKAEQAIPAKAAIARVSPTALALPDVPDVSDDSIITHDDFRFLDEAAAKGWQIPTATLARALDVQPSTITSHGQEFEALGFRFTRSPRRWKGAIQWHVSREN